MDANLIFQKTSLGEQAMQDRGRLSQRDLRTVLILVDGKRTVADICESRGNTRATESILDQLEHEGFIEPIAGHASESELERTTAQIADIFKRSTLQASTPTTSAAPSALDAGPRGAPSVAAPESTSDTQERREPVLGAAPPDIAQSPSADDASPVDDTAVADNGPAAEPVSLADIAASIREDIPELSAKPAESAPLPNPFATGPESVAPGSASARRGDTVNPFTTGAAARQSSPPRSDVSAPATMDPYHSIAGVAATIPAKRRRQFRVRLGAKGILAILGGLLLAALIGILTYPIDRALLEQEIARAVGQPVTVGSVHTALSPAPTIVIENLKVGDTGDLTVAEIRAVPQLSSLFAARKVFSNVTVRGATVPVERLGVLASGVGSLGDDSAVGVQRVHFNDLRLVLRDAAPQEFNGVADLTATGQLRNLNLARPDQTLRFEIAGQGDAASVRIEGDGWTPAEGSPYVFEALLVEGTLSGTRFNATKIEGRLLGGVMSGELTLDWGRGMMLAGHVGSSFMPTRNFLQTLGSPLPIDGELSGRLRFRTTAENWTALVRDLPVEGDFVAKKGNIDGMDLVEAVRRAGGPPLRGGVTKFDEIRGSFAYDGKQLRLSGIDFSSGLVHASGRVSVDKAHVLDGTFDVLLRGSAMQTRMPVALSGSLKAPELIGGRR